MGVWQTHPRLAGIRPFLHPNEPVFDHGLARWEELAEQMGHERATGFMVVTDRRLMWMPEIGRYPSNIGYEGIAGYDFRKKLMTAEVLIMLKDGQKARFNGGKDFLRTVGVFIDQHKDQPLPEAPTTTLSHKPGSLGLTCKACGFDVRARWAKCPACWRNIDWESSRQAVESHNVEARVSREEHPELFKE
jgi:hypothetical protein